VRPGLGRGIVVGGLLSLLFWVPVGMVIAVAVSPSDATEVTKLAAPAAGTEIHEDDPQFNCYQDGNQTCGDLPTYVLPDGTELAVLAPANDGNVYGSAPDGSVYLLPDSAWTE